MSLHVNYEIRWKNYRAFKDTNWIVLKPLTIFIGPNNAGKTSVASPLLLMDQTISSREAIVPLVTRGPVIDLGLYRDIVHNCDTTEKLTLGFRYHRHTDPPKRLGKLGSYPPGAIEATLSSLRHSEDPLLCQFALNDLFDRKLFSLNLGEDGEYRFESQWLKIKDAKELQAIEKSRPVNFLFSPASALRGLQLVGGREKTSEARFSKPFQMYLRSLGFMFEELLDVFRDLAYIGPLRDRPRRYYEISNDMPASVGSHGEHMATLLRRRLPHIRTSLNKWIREFEFGRELRVKSTPDGQLCSLAFVDANDSREINIADCGFGASQVLPLIVQALTAPSQSITIAEQPEIHLNPRLQYTLADLFVEMANNDRRVIVETHSEHLLLRLRRLIAQGRIAPDMVSLYFVERKDGISTIEDIPLLSDGRIEQDRWPKGFFEDSLRESLALATEQVKSNAKRLKRRGTNRP
ncbi:AAA family ATPase [Terriglobus albidus]|uniref:AAA family ATPase n=1 Tax=Terriglobus albidus TaxID=1592106 RepID=UPI0021E01E54|nr:DUF3696 domain-containing protein [Terriglobus albidus]